MIKYKEKRGNKYYQVFTKINTVHVPLRVRLFGKHCLSGDTINDISCEIHAYVYKGITYIHKELITERIRVPYHNSGWRKPTFKKVTAEVESCSLCEYFIMPNKCFHPEVRELLGNKDGYGIIKQDKLQHIKIDDSCPGYKVK